MIVYFMVDRDSQPLKKGLNVVYKTLISNTLDQSTGWLTAGRIEAEKTTEIHHVGTNFLAVSRLID